MTGKPRAELIAVDIGNTSTQIGVFAGTTLIADWRISSSLSRTADELRQLLRGLLAESEIESAGELRGLVCSVVPTLTPSFARALEDLSGVPTMILTSELDLGLEIRYADPSAVGPDRLANAVAAAELHSLPAIVVDLGTAITFDVIAGGGEYLGGIIAPGIRTSADTLFHRAARLPRVELTVPPHAVGTTTSESIQAGIVLGAAILIDGLVARIAAELDAPPLVIATGGDVELIRSQAQSIEVVDPTLTLKGMQLVEARLRARRA